MKDSSSAFDILSHFFSQETPHGPFNEKHIFSTFENYILMVRVADLHFLLHTRKGSFRDIFQKKILSGAYLMKYFEYKYIRIQ